MDINANGRDVPLEGAEEDIKLIIEDMGEYKNIELFAHEITLLNHNIDVNTNSYKRILTMYVVEHVPCPTFIIIVRRSNVLSIVNIKEIRSFN